MGLLSLFSRSKPDVDAAAQADGSDSVARARTRARQRLLGAVVLVGIGIVGFPLLFETQPRPIPVDVPIEIPARESVAPLKLPGEREPKAAVQPQSARKADAKPEAMITETAADAGRSVAGSARPGPEDRPAAPPARVEAQVETAQGAAEAADRPDQKSADKSTEKSGPKVEEKAGTKDSDKTADQGDPKAADAARARALLEGKPTPKEPATGTRYIVQIGAFADPALAQATRAKVERLGLKTYTHVAKTAEGDRTRVRVGPVTSREDADKIAAKIKAAGLTAAILTL